MGTVTFSIPAFSHGVHSDRVLSVQMLIDTEGRASHEFSVRSLFLAEAHNAREPDYAARVATHLRELANDLDALALQWKPAPKEPADD